MRNKQTRRQGDGERTNPPLPIAPYPQRGPRVPHSPLPLIPRGDPEFPTPTTDEWLEVGTIVAPQGLRGELRVYPDTDFPERFEVPGKRWLLRPGKTEPQPIELLAGRYVEGKNLYVIKLAGVENCNQAQELRGCKVMVHQTDRPHQLGEDEYHVLDLIGMFVFMQESGELVGRVIDVISAGNDLLEVQLHPTLAGDQEPKKVLIPFVKAIAPVVDLAAGRIEITPPLGLVNCF